MTPLTRFADVVSLSTSRIADPAAAGIERLIAIVADESAPQYMEALRTHCPARVESDLSDFHELRQGFIPPKPAGIERP
jgi:hypothetical protein